MSQIQFTNQANGTYVILTNNQALLIGVLCIAAGLGLIWVGIVLGRTFVLL